MVINGKNVLITGGAGFIGKYLVNALLKKDCQITIVDRAIGYSNGKVEYYCGNLTEYLLDVKTITKFDQIFHLAGNSHPLPSVHDPMMDFDLNLRLSMFLLESLRKAEKKIKLINISSAAVYGNPFKLPISENDKTAPLSPYGASKLAVEHYINVYLKLYGVQGLSVRPFSVYGPGLYKQVIFDLTKKLLNDPNQLVVFGDGSQLRDFIFIEDLIDSLLNVAENGCAGEVYNLASGTSYSINDVINIMCSILNIQPKMVFSGSVRSGEPDKWVVDISKLQSLGFVSKVNLKNGLQKTINWVKAI